MEIFEEYILMKSITTLSRVKDLYFSLGLLSKTDDQLRRSMKIEEKREN
jgi:hypothetical protein